MRLLCATSHCLLDRSSGAAISLCSLIETLHKEDGWTCSSFSLSLFDGAGDRSVNQLLADAGVKKLPDKLAADLWFGQSEGVKHYVKPVSLPNPALLSREEEMARLREAAAFMAMDRSDVLITFGSSLFERGLLKLAQDRGIKTAFYLANPSYHDKAVFDHVNMVLTDTAATRDLYHVRLGLNAQVIGKFVKPLSSAEDKAEATYVTFVNPAPEKGVTLFYRIAESSAEANLPIRFLVVESRARLEDALHFADLDFNKLANIDRVGLQSDLSAVLGSTKVLLLPSLWHESGARVLVEASSLGIPVIASNRGGSPELLGSAGDILDVPKNILENHWNVPSSKEADPWLAAIRRLFDDKRHYRERCSEALLQAQKLNKQWGVRKLVEALHQLVDD